MNLSNRELVRILGEREVGQLAARMIWLAVQLNEGDPERAEEVVGEINDVLDLFVQKQGIVLRPENFVFSELYQRFLEDGGKKSSLAHDRADDRDLREIVKPLFRDFAIYLTQAMGASIPTKEHIIELVEAEDSEDLVKRVLKFKLGAIKAVLDELD